MLTDPNFDYSEPEGVNLLSQYKDGRMWDHLEGQKLLEITLEYVSIMSGAVHLTSSHTHLHMTTPTPWWHAWSNDLIDTLTSLIPMTYNILPIVCVCGCVCACVTVADMSNVWTYVFPAGWVWHYTILQTNQKMPLIPLKVSLPLILVIIW